MPGDGIPGGGGTSRTGGPGSCQGAGSGIGIGTVGDGGSGGIGIPIWRAPVKGVSSPVEMHESRAAARCRRLGSDPGHGRGNGHGMRP